MGEQLTPNDVKKIKEEIEYRKVVVRKKELEAVEEKLLSGEDMTEDPLTKSHAKLRNYSRKCKRNRSERDWNCLFKSSGTGRSLQTDTRRKRSIFKIYKSSIK